MGGFNRTLILVVLLAFASSYLHLQSKGFANVDIPEGCWRAIVMRIKTTGFNRLTSPVSKMLLAVWQFSRPHTIYGTAASAIGLYLLSLDGLEQGLNTLTGLAVALIACLSANVYIVGLNQLCDVGIDRINKPYLPLAARTLTRSQGAWIVGIAATASLGVSLLQNPFLFATVLVSSAIGTAYSLPPIRLKRFPFFASLCIYTVRGVVVNVGLYLYFQSMQSLSTQLTLQLWTLVGFVLLFTLAIALFIDIPDMEGDYQFNVATVSILLGAKQTFHLCLGLLILTYGAVTMVAVWLPQLDVWVLGIGHAIAVALLGWYRYRLPSCDRKEVYAYYQLIWKLFYWEYLLFPLAYLVTR